MTNKNILITSEMDEKYYIVNNGAYSIAVLLSLLKEQKELSNIILEASTIKENNSGFLFVEKTSQLGLALGELIKSGQLIDESCIITSKHLVNAHINAIMNNEVSVLYLQTMENMLRTKSVGLISDLKANYPERILKLINSAGRKSWFNSDKNTQKFLQEISLTGYESKGIIYFNGEWCNIDFSSNSIVPFSSTGPIKEKLINS